jgi:hypothetical protein
MNILVLFITNLSQNSCARRETIYTVVFLSWSPLPSARPGRGEHLPEHHSSRQEQTTLYRSDVYVSYRAKKESERSCSYNTTILSRVYHIGRVLHDPAITMLA